MRVEIQSYWHPDANGKLPDDSPYANIRFDFSPTGKQIDVSIEGIEGKITVGCAELKALLKSLP